MAQAPYQRLVDVVTRLITKWGRANVQLYSVGQGTASDSGKPWKLDAGTAADPLEATVHGVFLFPNEARSSSGQFALPVYLRGNADLSDSVDPEATMMAYISAGELPGGAQVGWLVVTEGKRYSVLRSQPLQPADIPLLYILSLKG